MLNHKQAVFFGLNSFKFDTHMWKLFIALAFISFSSETVAQKTKPAKVKIIKKYKVPKLTASIGSFKDTAYADALMAESVIGLPLKVTDAKNNVYTISSYNFLISKIVATENEQTGKVSNTNSIKSALFQTTPLPAMWVAASRERLRPGEYFLFFDIIARDAEDRVMYAPNLKLIIK